MNKKVFNYRTLALALRSISDVCLRAWEQQQNGERVTACAMTADELEFLCEDYLPNLMNPMMSTEEVKERLHVSDATLNRMVARGDLPNGQCKKRGHTRYWKKWDVMAFLKKKKGGGKRK